jgi:hypothetical protein
VVTLDDSALLDNVGIGVLAIEPGPTAAPARAALTHVLVSGTRLVSGATLGGQALVAQSASVQAVECALLSNTQVAALAINPGATLDLERSLVEGTTQQQGIFGYGVLGLPKTTVLVTDTEIAKSEGIGLAVAGGSGSVFGGGIAHNAIGAAVFQGTSLRLTALPGDQPNGRELVVSDQTTFDGNASRLGNGDYPVPVAFSVPSAPTR